MSNYSTTQHGFIVSDGTAQTIPINTSIDIIKIVNYTEMAATNSGHGVEYHWSSKRTDSPIAAQNGYVEYRPAADYTTAKNVLAANSFQIVDTSKDPAGDLDSTISAISNAAIPVVTLTSTAALSAGDVVRLFDVTGAQQFGGMEFTIGNNTFTGTTFSLDYAPQIVAATSGSLRKISHSSIYAPRVRYVTKITKAASAVVTFAVAHSYTVGQVVKFNVSSAFGMTEIDGKRGVIIAVSAANNTITVDIDSSGFTTFAFPLTGAALFTPAHVNPVGENTAANNGMPYDDATRNTAFKGVILQAGAKKPGGSNNDVLYWEISSTFKVAKRHTSV